MILLRRWMVFFLSIQALLTHAQQFGGNPSSLRWKQINTDTARIIFPEGVEPTANRVATLLHELQKKHNATIGDRLAKINIVLQNQNTLANGYVGLGPYRSEFYLFAPQNSFEQGSINWADKLTLHEYRHVQQFSNFNVGLSKVARVLFGQEGQAVANSAAVPDYFFEGDAVFNETVLTEQGRGRQPLFFNGYQALYRQNKDYSYQKLRNGSLKDFVPDHYRLGYLLVGYGREKYGADFWKKVSQDAARFKPLIYPWQGAVKKYSGISYRQFVNDAFNYYHKLWQIEPTVDKQYLTESSNVVTDYKYPTVTDDGSVIALKRSYQQIPAFYKIAPDGAEEKIATRGIAYDDYFSYNNGLVTYSTLKPDERWSYREYGDIYLLNAETGVKEKITSKERFFAPDISHNGQKIVVVEMKTDQLSNLVIIDRAGKRLFRMNGDPGTVYTYPKFSANDSLLYVFVRNATGQMALQQINTFNSQKKMVLPFGNRIVGLPVVQGDTVFFTSSFKGFDEAWAFVENRNTVYRLARDAGGLYHPTFDHQTGKLIAANFTAGGFRLSAIDSKKLLWQKIEPQTDAVIDLYLPNALTVGDSNILKTVEPRDFAIKKYKKGFGLFNFHSWRPAYDRPEYSFTVYGQNVLNTLQSEVAYTYNENEGSSKVSLNLIYGGWYVQPFVSVNQTWNRTVNYNRDTTVFYNEKNAGFGLSLPLNFSNDRQFRYLTLSSSINTKQLRLTGLGKTLFPDRTFNFLQSRVSYAAQIQKAVQHIYPHWAQTLSLQYRTIVNEYTAHQFLASGTVYLPGLLPTHNLVFNLAYAARDTMNQYYFSDNFPFSRGYNAVDFPQMWRLGVNYHFPLVYPDFGIGSIVYFKRLRTNTFYDFTQTKSLRSGNRFFFKTTGIELFFDTKWWNQQDVTFGIRYSRLLDKQYRGVTQPNQWEIILPVNLFN